MQALALDMGGSHIGCGLVKEDRILAQASVSVEVRSDGTSDLATALPVLERTLFSLLSDTQTAANECIGIALGYPGIVDARSGRIYQHQNKYVDMIDIDLAGWARQVFGLTLRIENDARMALMGEHYAGAGRDCNDMVMMTLGTGIGASAIIHGRLLRGVHAHAGILGWHMAAKFDGRPCFCGNIGCAEAEASGWSMPLVAREWPGFVESLLAKQKTLGFRELFASVERGDRVAREVLDHCLHVWAANAVSLIHAYDPEILILGGGVMQTPKSIYSFVQEYVNQHTWANWGKVQVRVAALGNSAAFLGAIPLLTEEIHGA
jgi:glucokinase